MGVEIPFMGSPEKSTKCENLAFCQECDEYNSQCSKCEQGFEDYSGHCLSYKVRLLADFSYREIDQQALLRTGAKDLEELRSWKMKSPGLFNGSAEVHAKPALKMI